MYFNVIGKDETMLVALTTVDNPFNPITQFDEWKSFDFEHDYNTCELLARFAKTSPEFTEKEYQTEVEEAIDEIIGIFGNFYVKVTK